MSGENGEQVGQVACQGNLAAVQLGRGQYEEALATARTALAEAREIGSHHHVANLLTVIGNARDRMGAEGAAEHLEQAIAIFDELRVPEADEVREQLQAVRNV